MENCVDLISFCPFGEQSIGINHLAHPQADQASGAEITCREKILQIDPRY
jgi:hypothetical protein